MNHSQIIKKYLFTEDLSTDDPYDIWKTMLGQRVKQLYYKNPYLGIAPAGVFTLFDLYLNNHIRVGYQKQEYPIVRAQAALTLLNLYKKEPKACYLEFAKSNIDWLLANSSEGYSGYCWGLNFDWVYSAEETYDKNTPFSTHTPYPLEAMIAYYKVTKDETLLEPIKSLFLFMENEIQIMKESDEALILSYGVHKDRIVSNANSYLMYMYALLLEFLPHKEEHIRKKIAKIYYFISDIQQTDGSWLYAPYDESTFIDCFHSAFILKNIIKTDNIIALPNATSVVERGYNYLFKYFFDSEKSLFKRFSKSNKISLSRFDLYDNAEMLNLAIMLKDDYTIKKLSQSIKKNFMTQDNQIGSMIDNMGKLKNINHLRWAVVPYLHALSQLEKEA